MAQFTKGVEQIPTPQRSVSFCPASHAPVSFGKDDIGFEVAKGEDPSLAFLRTVAHRQSEACTELLHSSLPTQSEAAMQDITPRSNGFVGSVLEAYNRHRALIIRPDDVWLAILTQFSFFVNGNAEALRSTFVAHQGKKELAVKLSGNRYSIPAAFVANKMTDLMQENILDKSMREWVMPSFTTTTETDTAISAMVMMGTMKEYFLYRAYLWCGIPKVTLEGTKQDWEDILQRLEHLKRYGIQTIAWYHLLRPIISRFVAAYDNPTSPENLDFWSKVAHFKPYGSGSTSLSGWITAFCMFDERGVWKGAKFVKDVQNTPDAVDLSASQFAEAYLVRPGPEDTPYLTLDGFPYPWCQDVPYGYVAVDVKLNDNGQEFDTIFVAGLIGLQKSCTMNQADKRDTVRPMSGWWYFVKGPGKLAKGSDN